MIYGIYSIRDALTGFLPFTIEINDDIAKRNFESAILNADHSLFFTHPDDYSFYRLGSFDADSGEIETPAVPVFLCSASSVYGMRDKRGDDRV